MDWTLIIWRVFCLIVLATTVAAITGWLFLLPPLWLGLAMLPAFLVTLLSVVAWYADLQRSSKKVLDEPLDD